MSMATVCSSTDHYTREQRGVHQVENVHFRAGPHDLTFNEI